MSVHGEETDLSSSINYFSAQYGSTKKKIHKFTIEMFTLHITLNPNMKGFCLTIEYTIIHHTEHLCPFVFFKTNLV